MRHFALILSLLCVAVTNVTDGQSAAGGKDGLYGQVARLLVDLNSDRFEVRRKAAEQFEKLMAEPELKRELAVEFQRTLVRSDISFEVRRHIERWSRQLPSPPAEPVGDVLPKNLDDLVRRLDDDSYGVRRGAARRLDWLLGNPKLICPIMLRLKRRLSDDSLDQQAKRQLETVWRRARGAWLTSDVAQRDLPAVSDRQIDRWLDELVRPGVGAGDAANCELLDLLARDDYVPRLKRAIEARLSQKPSTEAAAKLRSLLDWTKPELVAEFWEGRRQCSEQHLIVGVPSISEGAKRPSHFDRVGERWAHCVSGNALVPGNYPVGEAFPYPGEEGAAFFRLVSLPTPRRRMAYVACRNSDEQKRLAAISRQTLDRVLADKRSLSEPELLMLEQLDPAELSRFAGRYFLLADDRETPQTGVRRLGGRPSRFGMICVRLAVDGRKDAMPALAEAIAKNRFLPPTMLAPYRLDLLAAFSIAARDPWPEVDAWLADRVVQSESLVERPSSRIDFRIFDGSLLRAHGELLEGLPSAADLGATAAALLLKRHGQQAAGYGLLPANDAVMEQLHVSGYRFGNKDGRAKIEQWWRQEKGRKKP
jgi:hypothetical protein